MLLVGLWSPERHADCGDQLPIGWVGQATISISARRCEEVI